MANSFIEELKRRNVFKVTAGYILLGWLVLQVADLIVPILELPEWTLKFLLFLGLIGFPFAIFFAWAYELTPDGLKRESELDESTPRRDISAKLNYLIIGLLVVALGYFIYESRFKTPDLLLDVADGTDDKAAITEASESMKTSAQTQLDESIAVLPFLNLSSSKDQEYFSDGLSDTILHMLAQDPMLRVAARTSSFKFKNTQEDIRKIAEVLGVSMVLEGSVQRQGNRVRITAQLINGYDGSHIWSKVYDDTMDDIFLVQDQIAKGVAEAIPRKSSSTSLTNKPPSFSNNNLAAKGGTTNLNAYEAYLKGNAALESGSMEGVREATAQLELATELDPNYALAWASLSRAYLQTATIGSETFERATYNAYVASRKSVELEPNLAKTQLAYARALARTSDYDNAQKAIIRANQLEPNNPESLIALSFIRSRQGEYSEAVKLVEKAILANPLDFSLKSTLAFYKLRFGQTEEAIRIIESTIDQSPDDLILKSSYIRILSGSAQLEKLARLLKRLNTEHPESIRFLFDSMILRMAVQDYKGALKMLTRVESISPERAYDDWAEYCIEIGDMECFNKYSTLHDEQLSAGLDITDSIVYKAYIAMSLGENDKAIPLLEGVLDSDGSQSDMSIMEGPNLSLMALYNRVGQFEKRDRLLQRYSSMLQNEIKNGKSGAFSTIELMELAAIKQDAALASEYLKTCIDNDYPISSRYIVYKPAFEGVINDATFKTQLERLKAKEIEFRDRMYSEGIF